MHEWGFDFSTNSLLVPRLEAMQDIIDTLEDSTIHIDQKVQLVNRGVHIVAAPFGGTGQFSKMLVFWEMIMKDWYDVKELRCVTGSHQLLEIKEIEKLINAYAWRDVIPYGMIVIDLSFQDKHVSPAGIAMIQSVMSKDNRFRG